MLEQLEACRGSACCAAPGVPIGGGASDCEIMCLQESDYESVSYRSGDLCTRYVRADLPLLNLSSKAGLDSVLGIGIALIALALLLMCTMAVVLLRMRKKTGRKRNKKGCGMALDHCTR